MRVGETMDLSVRIRLQPGERIGSWDCNPPEVAEVTQADPDRRTGGGFVTAFRPGQVTVVAHTTAGRHIPMPLRVDGAIRAQAGATMNIAEQVPGEEITAVASSNERVARAESAGFVIAASPGATSLTVTSSEGRTYEFLLLVDGECPLRRGAAELAPLVDGQTVERWTAGGGASVTPEGRASLPAGVQDGTAVAHLAAGEVTFRLQRTAARARMVPRPGRRALAGAGVAVPVLLVLTFGALRLTAGPKTSAKASSPKPLIALSPAPVREASAQAITPRVSITLPADGQRVGRLVVLRGTAEGLDEGTEIVPLVQPQAPGEPAYPQPGVRIRDGHWQARIVVGREGYGDLGAKFSVWVEAQADGIRVPSGRVSLTRR